MQDWIDGEPLNYAKAGEPYESQWELLRDCLNVLDERLYLLYKYHAWVGPQSVLQNMLGLVVTREQFEENLARSAQLTSHAHISAEEAEALQVESSYVQRRLDVSGALPLTKLKARFALTDEMLQSVIIALAPELDAKYEKLYAYLQDDIAKVRPGLDLATRLLAPQGAVLAQYRERFLRHRPFSMLFDAAALAQGELRLHERVVEYFLGNEPKERHGIAHLSPDDQLAPLTVHADTAKALCSALSASTAEKATPCVIMLTGAAGAGKKFLARHALASMRHEGVMLDLSQWQDGMEAIRYAALDAILTGSVLCICHTELLLDEEAPFAAQDFWRMLGASMPDALLLMGEKSIRGMRAPDGYVTMELAVEETDEGARAKLFSQYAEGIRLAGDVDLEEIAAKFRFGAGQIQKAMAQVKGALRVEGKKAADAALVHACCYAQAVHKLDALASPVKPAYTWDDLVLPAQQIRLMRQACAHVRYGRRVFGDWGFSRYAGYGKGLSMLFSGPPGTGKTMGAQVIAGQLRMELYKIQISQVVSKYIGETEKNLRAVFGEAKSSNCILFFDECDALFGKRSEVKDAHDRYANVETAYLLQQVEEHEGVTIMATNLMQNIDQAFMRRIGFVVHFPFPDKAARELMYRKMLSCGAPLEDVDYGFLAEKFNVAGGSIKNIVVNAAFMAASEDSGISMTHLLRCAVNELKKNEIIVVKEDLREYADLVFE